MDETPGLGEQPNDRAERIKALGAELDQMGWRNLRYIERMLGPYSLTFPQVLVLSFLQRFGPDLVMSSIADRTGLPASTITSVMDRLVKRGLAERHQGATDRRSVTGSITEQGLQILRELESQRDASLSTMLADFTDDELGAIMKLIDRWAALTDID